MSGGPIPVLYTTTDAIRATLGLTRRELYDFQITDLEIGELLLIELATVYPDHLALAATITGGTATDEEIATWMVLCQYTKYQAATYLLPQFQMLVTQRISDGDVEVARFGPDLQATIDRILGMRDKFLALLNPDLAGTYWPLLPVTVVTPDYDPVVNGPYATI